MTGVIIRRVALLLRQSIALGSVIFSFGFFTHAFAAVDAKTNYDISGTSTRAKTEFKKAPMELDTQLKDKLWERFQTKLKDMPFVTDVQIGEVTETKEDFGTYSSYITVKRSFPAFEGARLEVTLRF